MRCKQLPLSDPPIKCFQFDAYPLSILSNTTDYLPWFYCNYIQLCCNKDFIKEGVLTLEFYERMQAFKSPWLQTQAMYWDTVSKLNINIIDFFIEHIDLDYYIYTIVDEFYLPNRQGYRKFHFIHDTFIYGYDKNKKIFNYSGYNEKLIYSLGEVSFIDFENAFKSINSSEHNYCQNDMFFIRYYNNAKYLFDFQLVKDQISDYLYSINSSERYRRYSNPRNDKVFGMSIYECLRQSLVCMSEYKIEYDLRPFQILYEHKKCMVMRAEYIYQNMDICNYKQFYEAYKDIEDKALMCRNLMLRSCITKDDKILHKAICLLDAMAVGEKDVLLEIIQ